MLPPRPSCLRSSSPLPVTPSLLAGFCPFWLGLPPTLPGLGYRGRTHRASSHCHSTGTARAPQAEAVARLPHHRLPPFHPSSEGSGAWEGLVFFPELAWLCEVMGPGPGPLPVWERENMCYILVTFTAPTLLRPAGAVFSVNTEDRDESPWTLVPGRGGRQIGHNN